MHFCHNSCLPLPWHERWHCTLGMLGMGGWCLTPTSSDSHSPSPPSPTSCSYGHLPPSHHFSSCVDALHYVLYLFCMASLQLNSPFPKTNSRTDEFTKLYMHYFFNKVGRIWERNWKSEPWSEVGESSCQYWLICILSSLSHLSQIIVSVWVEQQFLLLENNHQPNKFKN